MDQASDYPARTCRSRVIYVIATVRLRDALPFACRKSNVDVAPKYQSHWMRGSGEPNSCGKGANYSLNLDRFIVTDAARVQQSLIGHLNSIADTEEAAFAAVAISKLKQDGVALDGAAIKLGLAESVYKTLFSNVLDSTSTSIYGQTGTGFTVDTGNGIVALGLGGNDLLFGGSGNDVYDGGAEWILKGRRWRDGENYWSQGLDASNCDLWRNVA